MAVAVVATGTAAAAPAGAVAKASASPRTTQTTEPIYEVHGFQRGGKADCGHNWGDAEHAFRTFGLRGKFVRWGYYKHDVHCTRKVNGNQNTRIQELGRLLAKDIYNNYSRHGKYVNAVGHSMGGLVINAALVGVHKYGGHNGWPPYLRVRNAVTLSSPFGGAGSLATLCTAWDQYKQCSDLRGGSGFLKWLKSYQNPQGRGGTDWTVIGAFEDSTVHVTSAVGTKAKHKVVYMARQGITHSNILHQTLGFSWHLRYSNDYGRTAKGTSNGSSPIYYAAMALYNTAV